MPESTTYTTLRFIRMDSLRIVQLPDPADLHPTPYQFRRRGRRPGAGKRGRPCLPKRSNRCSTSGPPPDVYASCPTRGENGSMCRAIRRGPTSTGSNPTSHSLVDQLPWAESAASIPGVHTPGPAGARVSKHTGRGGGKTRTLPRRPAAGRRARGAVIRHFRQG